MTTSGPPRPPGRDPYRTLGTGVTFNPGRDSFLGQNINQNVNGYDDGAQPVVFSLSPMR